jgi:rhodanese-related sulfurtransferase
VLTLKSKGMDNAAALLGGMNAWKNQGLPMEEGSAANANTQR